MTISAVLSSILAIILSLAFVIGLAWGGLYLLRKFQDGSFGKLGGQMDGRDLRFIRALPIGPRERLVMVEIDGDEMLLGVTAHSITQLREWPGGGSNFSQKVNASESVEQTQGDAARPKFRLRMTDGGEG